MWEFSYLCCKRNVDIVHLAIYSDLCKTDEKRDWLTVEGKPPANRLHRNVFLLWWPWPCPDDLDVRTWPRYSDDVPAYQITQAFQKEHYRETARCNWNMTTPHSDSPVAVLKGSNLLCILILQDLKWLSSACENAPKFIDFKVKFGKKNSRAMPQTSVRHLSSVVTQTFHSTSPRFV